MPDAPTNSKNIWGFDPRMIPGCKLWLDAADASTITGSVTSVRDKANSVAFTATGTVTTSTIGTTQCLNFGGSGYLSGSVNSLLTGTSFVVFKATAANNGYYPFFTWRDNAGQTNFPAFGYVSSNTIAPYTTYIGAGTPSNTTTIGNTYLASYSWTGTTPAVGINGATPTAGTQGAYTSTETLLWVGNDNGSYITANIGEIIIYDSVLTTTQRQEVEGYLAWKWGFETSTNSPTSIGGLLVWLDGADESTKTLSGTTVTAWRDKASSYSFTAATVASQGGITVTGPSNVAGGGVVFSNATAYNGNGEQALGIYSSPNNSSPLFTIPTQSATLIVASSPTSNDYYRAMAFLGSAQLGSSYLPNIVMDVEAGVNAGESIALDYNGSAWGGVFSPASQPTTLAPRIDIAVLAPGTASGFWNNGTNLGVTGSYTSSYSNYPICAFYIGGYTTTVWGNRNFNGTIYEVLFYSNALTTAQRRQVEGYLSKKWSIPLTTSLPNSHPFYSINPYLRTFRPLDIDGCALWLDGNDPTTLTLSGSNVTSWNDKSGNGNNANIVTSTPPTYVSNAVVFTASNSTGIRGNMSASLSNASVFIVSSYISNSGSPIYNPRLFILGSNNSTDNNLIGQLSLIDQGRSAIVTYVGNGTGNAFGVGNFQTGGTISFSTAYLYTNISTYSGTTFTNLTLLNGAPATYSSITGTKTTDVNYVGSANRYAIGNYTYSTAGPNGDAYNGNVYEVIVYSNALTTSQRQQVEGYIAWKWGINGRLPAYTITAYTYNGANGYSGSLQNYVVPSGITQLYVALWGGGGASSAQSVGTGRGGSGCYVSGILAVTPGETLSILVAGYGRGAYEYGSYPVPGGYGGGGYGCDGANTYSGGPTSNAGNGCGGGGRSAIQRSGADIVSAGGGGGAGYSQGGDAAWTGTATAGSVNGGGGGSQSGPGAYGSGGNPTIFGVGTAGSGNNGGNGNNYGGGGGGGYYGGGGGATAGGAGGDGGGGSSYTSGLSSATGSNGSGGNPPGTSLAYYVSGVATGGNCYGTQIGGPGLVVISTNPLSTSSSNHPFNKFPSSTVLPFSPLQITGCCLWLDGNDPAGTGTQPSAGALATWVDKSGSKNNMTAAGTTPTFSNYPPGAVVFGGAGYYSNASPVLSNYYTAFFVYKQTASIGPLYTTGASSGSNGLFPNEAGTTYFTRGDSTWYSTSSPFPVNVKTLASVNFSSNAVGSNESLYYNGSNVVTTTQANTITYTNLLIGSRQSGGTEYFTGYIYEVLAYAGALTMNQQQRVEGYLAQKWKL